MFGATISEFEVLVQRLASAYLRFYTSTDADQLSLLRNEVLQNQYIGSTDIVIGQDNFWNFEPSGVKQRQNKKYGFIKTKFGWSLCGYISKKYSG